MSARAIDFSSDVQRGQEQTSIGSARPISLNEKDINRFRSLISAPVKGMYKGAIDIGRMLPILLQGPNLVPYLLTGHSVLPKDIEKKYKQGLQKGEEFIEQTLPTRPEFLESALERGGKLLPAGLAAVATGGSSLLPQLGLAGAAGLAGQTVEEFGGGPFLQSLAEVAPYAGPSLARKIVASSAEQKKILDLGRSKGLTEEQLAPLMPETAKKRFFGKFAHTSESTKDTLKTTRQGVQNIYDIIETGPDAKKILPQQHFQKFASDMSAIGRKMPYNIRAQLKNDAEDFVKSVMAKGGATGEELMNFYHDISSRYNLGRTQLELFKGPIKDALKIIDPKMAHDFETVNRMYAKSLEIGRILKPSQYEQLISLGEAYELGAAAANLDAGRLRKILGFLGFRKLSEKMLTSPRLQNLIKKSQIAIEQNNLPLLKKAGDQILNEFKEK